MMCNKAAKVGFYKLIEHNLKPFKVPIIYLFYMLYTLPTKRGLGVELWGTYEDLHILYDTISSFWNDSELEKIKGFSNRDMVVSSFSYEIRHAFQGDRLKQDYCHFYHATGAYLGCQFSWVHIFFTLAVLRYNMRFTANSKMAISIFLQLEYWLERSLYSFDESNATKMIPYLDGALYGGNDYAYQYMRSINFEYFRLKGGKAAFRKLPNLLRRGIYQTQEYNEYRTELQHQASIQSCNVEELDLDEDDKIYQITW